MYCKICNKEFKPNKYHPNQRVCPDSVCQHKRQIQNIRQWRAKNPEYFKCRDQEEFWRKNRRNYSRSWRMAHKDYLREYSRSHREERREYMREYMRRYRAIQRRKKESRI